MNIKVCIQQPALPIYRKSLFEKLAELYDDLTIYFGNENLAVAKPNNAKLHYSKLIKVRIFNITIKWHYAQLLVISKKFNCAIINWDIGYITIWLSLIKKFFTKVPVMLWGHGYSKNDNRMKIYLRNLPIIFADAVLVYDYHTAEILKKNARFRDKIFVAPNSLDDQKIKEAIFYWNKNPTLLKRFQENNKIHNTYNLIYIGRIYEENELEILIQAFKLVNLMVNDVRLIIIGGFNNYVKSLQELAKNLGVYDKIIWTDAIYDELEIAPWMLSSKIFVYPANIGLSLIHAFNYGLPVITHNCMSKHGPEIYSLIDNHNGLLYEFRDVLHFSEQILYLINHEDIRLQMSVNALNTIKTQNNLDNMISGFNLAIHYAIKSVE